MKLRNKATILVGILFSFFLFLLVTRKGEDVGPTIPTNRKTSPPIRAPQPLKAKPKEKDFQANRRSIPRDWKARIWVRDIENHSPIPGASLFSGKHTKDGWIEAPSKLAASDASGFIVLGSPSGTEPLWASKGTCLFVRKDGYLVHALRWKDISPDEVNNVFLRKACRVRFTFRDTYGGPIRNFKVVLSKHQLHEKGYGLFKSRIGALDPGNFTFLGISGKDGRVVLGGIPKGSYRIVLFHESYIPTGGLITNYIKVEGDKSYEITAGKAYIASIKIKGDSVVDYRIHNPILYGNSVSFQTASVIKRSLSDRFPGCYWSITTGDEIPGSKDPISRKKAVFHFLLATAGARTFFLGFVPADRFTGPVVKEIPPVDPPLTLRGRLSLLTPEDDPFPPGSEIMFSTARSLSRALRSYGGNTLSVVTGEPFHALPGNYRVLRADPILKSALSGQVLAVKGDPRTENSFVLHLRKKVLPVDLTIKSPSGGLPDYGRLQYTELMEPFRKFSKGIQKAMVRVHAGPVRFRIEIRFFGFKKWTTELDGSRLSDKEPHLVPVELEYADSSR